MIQRKQTLFLLAVAIIAILMLFIPFQKISQSITGSEDTTPAMIVSYLCLLPGCGHGIVTSNIYIPMILNFLVIILSMLTIFQYKKRNIQYKLANLILLLNVFIVGIFFLLSFVFGFYIVEVSFVIGAFLPLLGAIFAFLSGHFIKKDEQLVRSADRIR